jgi:PTH1 family peptidyl-tRNA hydrolase
MNDSGRAVGALVNFYKVPQQRVLVVFDDLDLPYGAVRLRSEGGAGGHNGMRSIIQHLGSNQFPRLRIGIGRPPGRMDPAAFVLQDFGREEQAELDNISDRAVKAIDAFISGGITTAMNQFNSVGEKENHE